MNPRAPESHDGPRRRPRRAAPGLQQLPWRRLTNPFRPLEILSADQVEAIHRASLRILAEIGVEVLGDRALDAFARRRRDASTARTAASGSIPTRSRRSSRPRPSEFDAPRAQPRAEHRVRWLEPRLRRGRRAGLRQRPRSRPARRQLRRLRRLRPAHRRARRHPPGGRRPARADRPAGRDAPPRHVPDLRGRARQDVAVPRASARVRSTTRSRSPASSAASTATTLAPRAVADDGHQHELAAPPRRPDGRRPDRDGRSTASRSWPRRSRWPAR